MSLPPLDITLPTDQLHVTTWSDPVIDQLGHDPRSSYVEQFWLPVLGPTTTLLMRRLATGLEEHPDGYDLPLLDTATALGLGTKGGRNAPFLRAIARAARFNVVRMLDTETLAVRPRIPPLTRVQVDRLPPHLRDEHDQWQAAALHRPDAEQQRRRARRLALSLLELGESDEAVEQQLHRWKFHPAMAHEALRWAAARRKGEPPGPRPGQVFGPGDDAPRSPRPARLDEAGLTPAGGSSST